MRASIHRPRVDRVRARRAAKPGTPIKRILFTAAAVVLLITVARVVLRAVLPAMIDRCCGALADERCDQMRGRCARVFGGSSDHWRVSTAA